MSSRNDSDDIQILPPKSALKSGLDTKAPLKKQVSFNIELIEEEQPPELPIRIITRPPSIYTNSNSNHFPDLMDTSSDTSSVSAPIPAPKKCTEQVKNVSWWSSIFSSFKSNDAVVATTAVSTKRTNPITWVSSKLVSLVNAASSSHHISTSKTTPSASNLTQTSQRPIPSPPLPARVNALAFNSQKLKRDSGISILDDQQARVRPKVHLCSYCGGTTMINPYRLCPECNGAGVSDTSMMTDIYQSSRRVVTSLFEWISPSKPAASVPIPMTTITSYPRTSYDSNSSGVRNPRSSLDPGPQASWSQELDYRRVTKHYVKNTNLRRSGLATPVPSAKNHPLKQILQVIEAPSEVGFNDLV